VRPARSGAHERGFTRAAPLDDAPLVQTVALAFLVQAALIFLLVERQRPVPSPPKFATKIQLAADGSSAQSLAELSAVSDPTPSRCPMPMASPARPGSPSHPWLINSPIGRNRPAGWRWMGGIWDNPLRPSSPRTQPASPQSPDKPLPLSRPRRFMRRLIHRPPNPCCASKTTGASSPRGAPAAAVVAPYRRSHQFDRPTVSRCRGRTLSRSSWPPAD